jgi:hypothetical protein
MQLIFHGFNSTFYSLVLNFGLDGIYFSDCFNWICLISFWTIYIICKLDLHQVCSSYENQEKALSNEEEAMKLKNTSSQETLDHFSS